MKVIRTAEFHQGDVYRLPKAVSEIHVLSGNAWVTVTGRDIVLGQGEVAMLIPGERDAVLTPLGNRPLVIEEIA